jgi:hypothetical protein
MFKGPLLVDISGVPRFWASAWLSYVPGDLAPSTISKKLIGIEALYRYSEEWRSRNQLARQLAQKDARIAELERQLEILRVSHIAMMRAVGELGGTSKLLKMYEGYREFRGELQRLGLLDTAEVKTLVAKNTFAD